MLRQKERERVCFLSVWIVFVGVWVWERRERCEGYFWNFEKNGAGPRELCLFKKLKTVTEIKNKNNYYIYSYHFDPIAMQSSIIEVMAKVAIGLADIKAYFHNIFWYNL